MYVTETRWSPERDDWEVRLYDPKGVEVARMSWPMWKTLSANQAWSSGPELPPNLPPDDLYLACVSAEKKRQKAKRPMGRLTIVGGAHG